MTKKIIPIFIPHQGCPNDCVFCNQKKITGKNSSINFEEITNDISRSLKTINESSFIEIAFFGGSFTAISIEMQKKCLEIANYFMINDNRIRDIRISTRPDYINQDNLSLLKKYRVTIIELGVQSLDLEVLELSERGHDDKCVYFSSQLIKNNGFKLGLQMMIGLPSDNFNKSLFTCQEFIKIKPDYIRIYPVLVIKDTKLEEMFNNNIFFPNDLEKTIEIVKKIFILFTINNINVIRIGLQSSVEINYNGSIVAGPFHPAFGELVYSRIYRDFIELFIINNNIKGEIIINLNSKLVSQILGNKKQNYHYFINNYKIKLILKENPNIKESDFIINSVSFTKIIIFEKLIEFYFQ